MIDKFTPQNPQFPDVSVQLAGSDGNAFAVMGVVSKALRHAGHGDAVKAYMEECTSGDYDHLLHTSMCTVNCF